MPRYSLPKPETPSQTAGPYVHIGCAPTVCGLRECDDDYLGRQMVSDSTPGERITITGFVYDGAGAPVKDALIEIWQADSEGKFQSAYAGVEKVQDSFAGWGRQATDLQTGRYTFETIKPGVVVEPDGSRQAPHVSIWIVARGINLGLNTRLYFPDEPAANAVCPVLSKISDEHRETLMARQEDEAYVFDIHLQGSSETVFLDI